MAQAMERALLTGEGVEGEYMSHHHQQFGVYKSLCWALGATPRRKEIPPHITRAIQGISTTLVDVR
jgi:hypothetical protein